MADSTIVGLTELTTIATSSLFVIVDDPLGTPVTKKIYAANALVGAAKFWLMATGDGTAISASYGVSSITDTGAGDLKVNFATPFSSSNYCVNATCQRINLTFTVTNAKDINIKPASQTTSSISIICTDNTATTNVQEDPLSYHVVGHGVQ